MFNWIYPSMKENVWKCDVFFMIGKIIGKLIIMHYWKENILGKLLIMLFDVFIYTKRPKDVQEDSKELQFTKNYIDMFMPNKIHTLNGVRT